MFSKILTTIVGEMQKLNSKLRVQVEFCPVNTPTKHVLQRGEPLYIMYAEITNSDEKTMRVTILAHPLQSLFQIIMSKKACFSEIDLGWNPDLTDNNLCDLCFSENAQYLCNLTISNLAITDQVMQEGLA